MSSLRIDILRIMVNLSYSFFPSQIILEQKNHTRTCSSALGSLKRCEMIKLHEMGNTKVTVPIFCRDRIIERLRKFRVEDN